MKSEIPTYDRMTRRLVWPDGEFLDVGAPWFVSQELVPRLAESLVAAVAERDEARVRERERLRREMKKAINQWLGEVLDGGFDFDRAMGAKAACSAALAALDRICPEEVSSGR